MEFLLGNIDDAMAGGLWILGVYGALTVPDICGALNSADGRATPDRYRAWFDANLTEYKAPIVDGDAIYKFRCSLLHQGITSHDKGLARVVFALPDPMGNFRHRWRINDVLLLDAPTFCQDMTTAARKWLAQEASNPAVVRNLERGIQVHPHGYQQSIIGVPLLG